MMRSTRATGLACILMVFLQVSIFSQDVFQGIVLTIENGEEQALPGANIRILGKDIGTSADVNGRFELVHDDSDDQIIVSFTGYQNDTLELRTGLIRVVLSQGLELQTVDVVSQEESTSLSLLNPLNVQTMNTEELCKAACCNLSESFETNASVDASFSDAITGTRQIKMLGLSGRYSQIMKDNIPEVRGLSTIYGLGYVPGAWIKEISIAKGTGSVVNGFESITGDINVGIKDALMKEKAHFNLYANQGGRLEFNGLTKWSVGKNWKSILLTHTEHNSNEIDNNDDGFVDNPQHNNIILRNQWIYDGPGKLKGRYAIDILDDHGRAGQIIPQENLLDPWQMHTDAQRIGLSAKTGYILDEKRNRSLGSQLSYSSYDLAIDAGEKDYQGTQESSRINLLYAHGMGENTLVLGTSFIEDRYKQNLDTVQLDRLDQSVGAFAEFTWNASGNFRSVLGLRYDEHNRHGALYSPRLHIRYLLNENLSLKAAVGRGHRTVNSITDNLGFLASNRQWNFEAKNPIESAWNSGLNMTYKFRLDYRDAEISIDAYRTEFDKRTLVDVESPALVHVYESHGTNYSNTFQAQFNWELMKRTEIRIAYRYTEAKNSYTNQGVRAAPFTPRNRGFVNLAYKTRKQEDKQWKFDATAQYVGTQRIPKSSFIAQSGTILQRESYDSKSFFNIHGQITRVLRAGMDLYLGVENAGNFKQEQPILNAEHTDSPFFDASQVWAPVFGRMIYLGFRWDI